MRYNRVLFMTFTPMNAPQEDVPQANTREKLADRLKALADQTERTTMNMLDKGASEKSLAGIVAVHEHLNRLIDMSMLDPGSETFQGFVEALLNGMRTVHHSLSMGNLNERGMDQAKFAKNPWRFSSEIKDALKRTLERDRLGPPESIFLDEYQL